MKSFLAILTLIFAFQTSMGQEVNFEGNWYREIFGYEEPESKFYFFFYTKDDVIKAKRKFNLIKQSPFKDEWEGVYKTTGGEDTLRWNSGGFIFYRVHIALLDLDYGTATNAKDHVKLLSEKPLNSNKNFKLFNGNFIKVKFGNKRFLVPEEGIEEFTKEAAGLYTFSPYSFNFWWKDEDSEKDVFGLPILPEKYKSFLRYPIEAEIIKVGKRETVQSKNAEGKFESHAVKYHFTINAGRNKGLEKGRSIYILEMKEWAEIDKVSQTSSTAFIERGVDLDGKEICTDKNSEEHECGALSLGMNVQTQTSL